MNYTPIHFLKISTTPSVPFNSSRYILGTGNKETMIVMYIHRELSYFGIFIKCFLLYPTNEIDGALNESVKAHVKMRRERQRVKRDVLKQKQGRWEEHFGTLKMEYENYKMGQVPTLGYVTLHGPYTSLNLLQQVNESHVS